MIYSQTVPGVFLCRPNRVVQEWLQGALRQGYECYPAFVIAINGVREVLPHRDTAPAFGAALDAAVAAGVKVLKLPCFVEENRIEIRQ